MKLLARWKFLSMKFNLFWLFCIVVHFHWIRLTKDTEESTENLYEYCSRLHFHTAMQSHFVCINHCWSIIFDFNCGFSEFKQISFDLFLYLICGIIKINSSFIINIINQNRFSWQRVFSLFLLQRTSQTKQTGIKIYKCRFLA